MLGQGGCWIKTDVLVEVEELRSQGRVKRVKKLVMCVSDFVGVCQTEAAGAPYVCCLLGNGPCLHDFCHA